MICSTSTIIITLLMIISLSQSNQVNCLCPMKCTCIDEKLSVDCKEASLDIIPFTLNPEIRELFLSFNQIKSIKESFTYYTKLSLLDLSSNQISSLHRKHFNKQRSLQLLILSSNRLSHLTNESFAGLESLRLLNLADNQLTILTDRVFTGLTRLEKLDLSRNTINHINDEAFYGLNELKWLSLRSNRLSTIPSSSLYLVPSLSTLDLGHNGLFNLTDHGFASLARLIDLRLDLCSIVTISPSWAHGMVNLKRLQLDGNNLETIGSYIFNDITSLEELIIGANGFTTIEELTFHSLGNSLINLDIRYARDLINFHPKSLLGLTRLTQLTIEYSPKLTTLPSELLKDSSDSLRELRLRGNGLTHLPYSLLTSWSSLTVFDIRDNQWNCNCSILWLWKYLRKTINLNNNNNSNNSSSLSSLSSSTTTTTPFSDLICSSPSNLKGKSLSSLTADEIDCYNPHTTFGTLIVGSLIIGLIMIITIILMFLWCRTRLPLILLRHKKFTNNLTEEFVYEKGRFIESQVMFPPTSSPYHPNLHQQYHQHHQQSPNLSQHLHPNPNLHPLPHHHLQLQHQHYHSTSSPYHHPNHPSSSLIIIQSPAKMGPISQV